MKIHKRLIFLVGLGMLLIMAITVISLQNMTSFFSTTTGNIRNITFEVQRIWSIERKINEMSQYVHYFVESKNDRHRRSYEAARAEARSIFDEMGRPDAEWHDREIFDSMNTDYHELEKKAARIFSLDMKVEKNYLLAHNLTLEMESLLAWMGKDIDLYKEEGAARMATLAVQLKNNELRINILLVIILLASAGLLLVFSVYLHRKVSIPLTDLWEGTEAISSGNLDYRMAIHGEGDIVRLGERFNEMAQKLKGSYADLEEKLLDRTRELAALDAVALTLGQSGSLKDVLQKSLGKILESFSGMEPRGGIFLCDQDGEHLHLVTHQGLSPEFVQQEETIRMGECLCGMVAQTGEMLFTEQGCNNPHHTHDSSGKGHSHIIVPIKSRGIVLGVIFLYPRKDFKLKPSDVQMLDSIGAQLGMAVENFRFYGEVKESSEKYWDLFENSRDILFTLDREGRLAAVNRASEQFLGLSKIDLIGKSIMEFVTDEGAAIVKRALAGKRIGARELHEFQLVRKDGSHAFLDINARVMRKNRQATGFQISARDVTEQKLLREMLVKAERLAAIFEVGTAVRHEINNPLTTVIGNAELLLERYEGSSEDLKKRLEVILSNGLRIAEIVKKLEDIKKDRVVEYLKGIKMTDLMQE